MRTRRTLPIGTTSEGTLYTEDLLLEASLGAVGDLRLTREEQETIKAARKAPEEEALEALAAILQAHTPDYCYFGMAKGSEAYVGVWPDWERINEERRTGELHSGEALAVGGAPKSWTHFLVISDRGNATLYRRAGRRWIEVWSIV